ncbi:MAG: hypothetical protein RRY12_11125 [Cloacibacillus sp.]
MLRGKKGFVFISTIMTLGAAAIMLFALATAVVSERFEEKGEIKARMELENAACFAAACAERWFRGYVAANADPHDYTLYAAPKNEAALAVPAALFDALKEKYKKYIFTAEASDLYYPPSFAQEAGKRRLPYIQPYADTNGDITRAYYITVKAQDKERPYVYYSLTRSMRATLKENGKIEISCVAVFDQ